MTELTQFLCLLKPSQANIYKLIVSILNSSTQLFGSQLCLIRDIDRCWNYVKRLLFCDAVSPLTHFKRALATVGPSRLDCYAIASLSIYILAAFKRLQILSPSVFLTVSQILAASSFGCGAEHGLHDHVINHIVTVKVQLVLQLLSCVKEAHQFHGGVPLLHLLLISKGKVGLLQLLYCAQDWAGHLFIT